MLLTGNALGERISERRVDSMRYKRIGWVYLAKVGKSDYPWNQAKVVGAADTEEEAKAIMHAHLKSGLHGYIQKVEKVRVDYV